MAANVQAVTLEWDNSGPNEGTGMERSAAGSAFGEIGRVGPGLSQYVDTLTLQVNVEYCWRAYAFIGSNRSAYSNMYCYTLAPLTLPTSFSLTLTLPASTAVLSAQVPTGAEGLLVERRQATGRYVEIVNVPVTSGTVQVTDAGVRLINTRYCYRYRFYGQTQTTPYSQEACMRTPHLLTQQIAVTVMTGTKYRTTIHIYLE